MPRNAFGQPVDAGRVLAFVRTTRHPVTRHDVAAALAITPDQASAVLSRLWRAGDVRRREVPARERYARRPFVLYTASASR